MNELAHPPRPRLALRVGVTGHRSKDLATANLDTLNTKIHAVLQYLRDFTVALRSSPHYDGSGKPVMRVISAVAEGSDRYVARVAIDLGYEIQCPLPFDRQEYERDFESAAAIDEFRNLLAHDRTTAVLELDGTRDKEPEAYEAAGHAVLSQSDVLLAIWNGIDRHKRGGTSEIVAKAIGRGVAVVRIDSAQPHDVTVCVAGSRWDRWQSGSSALTARLQAVFIPPIISEEDEETSIGSEEYFAETQPSLNWGFVWLPFRDLMAGRPRLPSFGISKFSESGRNEWRQAVNDSPAFSEHTVDLIGRAALLDHYGWIHGLADYYGNVHRSAFTINYLLGASAVLLGFLHFAFENTYSNLGLAFTTGEGAILLFVTLIYIYGRFRRWHQRWIDYRLLAEYLRQMFFLIPLGLGELSSPHIPAHMRAGDPRNTWMYWHYQALRRSMGMIDGKFNGPHLEAVRAFLASDSAIEGQVKYHDNNMRCFHALNRSFTVLGFVLFSFAFAAAIVAGLASEHVSAISNGPQLKIVIGFCATVFPAFGAALAGIRSQGEFERVERRSDAMRTRLEIISKDLARLAKPNEVITSARLQQIVSEAGQLLIDELLDWRIVFKYRPLPEPE